MTQYKHVKLQQTPDGIVFKGWEDEMPDEFLSDLSHFHWHTSGVVLPVKDEGQQWFIYFAAREKGFLASYHETFDVTPFVEVVDGKVCYKEPVKMVCCGRCNGVHDECGPDQYIPEDSSCFNINLAKSITPPEFPKATTYSDAIEFLEWHSNEGYKDVWSKKHKARKWTKEGVLVNGSDYHYERLFDKGYDAKQLYEIFIKSKQK